MKKRNLKRGAVLELVIFLMVVIVFLSSLLISNSVILTKYKQNAFSSLTEKVRIDEATESVIRAYLQDKSLNDWKQENLEFSDFLFGLSENDDGTKVTLTVSAVEAESGDHLITAILLKNVDGSLTVLSWDY